MNEADKTEVIYRYGIHPTEGWDTVQVIHGYANDFTGARRTAYSFTIARAADGTILRYADPALNLWVIITNEDDQRILRSVFDKRDNAAAAHEAANVEA